MTVLLCADSDLLFESLAKGSQKQNAIKKHFKYLKEGEKIDLDW